MPLDDPREITAHDALDGEWVVERVSGLLPPMVGVRKTIHGTRGETRVGRLLSLPFTVSRGAREAVRIDYRPPLAMIADELAPDGAGGWSGTSRIAGVPLGRFRMRRP